VRALDFARAALERRGGGDSYAQKAWALYWYRAGAVADAEGKAAEAVDAASRSVALLERIDPGGEMCGIATGQLGTYLVKLHRSSEAIAAHRRALTVLERRLGPNHPSIAAAALNLGYEELNQDHVVAALALYDRALAIDRAHLPPGAINLGYDLFDRGDALARLGRTREAIVDATEGLAIVERNVPKDSGDLATPSLILGGLLVEHEPQRGAALLERAVKLAQPDDPDWSEASFRLAKAIERRDGRRAAQLAGDAESALGKIVKQDPVPRLKTLLDEIHAWRTKRRS
jgi:tetratricopeptide (TPR) repeat protein